GGHLGKEVRVVIGDIDDGDVDRVGITWFAWGVARTAVLREAELTERAQWQRGLAATGGFTRRLGAYGLVECAVVGAVSGRDDCGVPVGVPATETDRAHPGGGVVPGEIAATADDVAFRVRDQRRVQGPGGHLLVRQRAIDLSIGVRGEHHDLTVRIVTDGLDVAVLFHRFDGQGFERGLFGL